MNEVRVLTDTRKEPLPCTHANLIEGKVDMLGRLPHGMVGGNSSIVFLVKLDEPLEIDGVLKTHMFAEVSLKIFKMASEIFVAAEEHAKTTGAN